MHALRIRAAVAAVLVTFISVGLSGCASSMPSASDGADPTSPSVESPAAPLDLTGEWKQSNSKSEDSYQVATITADAVEIYWVTDGGETKSLYWAGSYDPPTDAVESYSWESVNDHSKTDTALLASGDDTKGFDFDGETISYEVSALGTTTTVKLERQ